MTLGIRLVDLSTEPPPWRHWPETEAVLAALEAEGGHARFVGGCVRDALLGVASGDIDIATDLLPGAVIQGLERAGIKAVPTGLDHGTVTAVCGDRAFEITSLRRDLVTFGRHAEVAFTHDWELDAARRDFTFNALYLDPKGELIDPVGGLADLALGCVRFIGSADDRIREDRLRVLRYFRFHARFGRGEADAHALDACRKSAGELGALSAERVQKEMLLLLATPDPVPALHLMAETGVLAAVTEETCDIERASRLIARYPESDALLRFAALLGGDREAVLRVAARLRFSNHQKERLALMCGGELREGMSEKARRALLYQIGAQGFIDQTLLLASVDGAAFDAASYLDAAACWVRPEFPVSGHDLLARGMAPGAELGALLHGLEARWIASDFRLTRAELLESLDA